MVTVPEIASKEDGGGDIEFRTRLRKRSQAIKSAGAGRRSVGRKGASRRRSYAAVSETVSDIKPKHKRDRSLKSVKSVPQLVGNRRTPSEGGAGESK